MQPKNHAGIITSLTALWAFSESGLGGLMFALQIPLTGIFVGGFAVVVITLIAWYSKNSYKQIIQSTLLVLMVKAAVSPHAPLPAYLAVSFQGVMGAFLFTLLPRFRLAAVMLGMLAMAESALQKIIVLTILFGRSVWEAVDALFKTIVKDFDLQHGFSWYIITTYVLLHVLWGFAAGWWSAGLPPKIIQHKEEVLNNFFRQAMVSRTAAFTSVKKRKPKFIFWGLILLFIATMIVFDGKNVSSKLVYVLARTLLMLLLMLFAVQPLFKWLMQKWVKSSGSQSSEAAKLVSRFPLLRSFVKPAWQMAAKHKSTARAGQFVMNMIVLSIYGSPSNIFVFSRPIQTGKTGMLFEFLKHKKSIAGILTPDVNGMRKLYDISTGEYFDLQVSEYFSGEKITIGKFIFDKAIFDKAGEILLSALQKQPDWLIVDEVGKLEVEQSTGLHFVVLRIIEHYNQDQPGRLILVIRDSLLQPAIEKYQLTEAQVINDLGSL